MRGYGGKQGSYDSTANLFNDTHPEVPPISKSTVKKTVDRFTATRSVADLPRSGRGKSATNEEKALDALLGVIEDPHVSLRKLSQTLGVSTSSVPRILKTNDWHPHKIRLMQEPRK